MRAPLSDRRLYLVATSSVARMPLPEAVEAAIRGGADLVQLREKTLPRDAVLSLARALLVRCRAHGVPLIVNDRVDVAAAAGAAGVHLGQEDAPIPSARAALPAEALVGISVHDAAELARALRDRPDYVGVGAVFATATKGRPVPVGGLGALAPLASRAEAAGIPAFAIGGIVEGNVARVAAAGFRRIAVCAGVLATHDPERAARRLREALG